MTTYVARQPNADGVYEWTDEENSVWKTLMSTQRPLLEKYACSEFLAGLDQIGLTDEIPSLDQISEVLGSSTGWSVAPVPALISFGKFFDLLASKQFPVATFIRRRDEIDYLQEPDIFHEILGHCPLLTHSSYAGFTEAYGKIGAKASKQQRVWLARLYWFTIEFGLINTKDGLRCYGGGILSSPKETVAAIESTDVERLAFDPVEILRTDYRIDRLQQKYFVIDDLSDLDALLDEEQLFKWVDEAQGLGIKPYKECA